MLVIPAIDIMGGKCVRLLQGKFSDSKIYANNPIDVARKFKKEGATLLHIVDLDGARVGCPVNTDIILDIAESVDITIQVGGGLRTYENAKHYLKNGVKRIILGTIVFEKPDILERLLQEFGHERILVSMDVKDGMVVTHGWLEDGPLSLEEAVSLLKHIKVTNVIVSDVSRDGLLKGPNFKLARQFICAGFQTIAASGISSLEDLRQLNRLGCLGAVVGRALYEGGIDLPVAKQAVAYKNTLAKRIIACLDIKSGRVVKGVHFRQLCDAGDPVELGKRYSEQGADELVFLDITATLENRKTLRDLVSRIAKEINIPFTVGGGITSLEDMRCLLKAGADKISICSAAVDNPGLIKDAASYFGSQCVVISVDAKKKGNRWNICIKGGTQETDKDAIEFSKRMETLGAGELLVNSLDRDGTKSGFDLDLLKSISQSVNVPVIASSGAGSMQDFLNVFQNTTVDAALGARVFHDQTVQMTKLKNFLFTNGVIVRI